MAEARRSQHYLSHRGSTVTPPRIVDTSVRTSCRTPRITEKSPGPPREYHSGNQSFTTGAQKFAPVVPPIGKS